jgi:hypothetical protein
MVDASLDTQRPRLLFCVRGLALRDELVIKSLVRLLGHRTHHHWIYSPDNTDLDMVGNAADDVVRDTELVSTAEQVQVVRVGRTKEHQGPFLSLPVNSNEFELLLNDLGRRISESKSSVPAAPDQAQLQTEFRLLRWPLTVFLAGPGRMKMATVIMGRSLSATALAQRAGVSLEECTSYLSELQTAGYLTVTVTGNSDAQAGAVTAPPAKEKVASGLLARIRSRLGLT